MRRRDLCGRVKNRESRNSITPRNPIELYAAFLCHTHSQLCVGVCVCVVTLAVNAQLLSLACATFVSGNADLRNVGLGISHLDQTA